MYTIWLLKALSPAVIAYLAIGFCILLVLAWPGGFASAWLYNELDAWPVHLLRS